jgi:hypothetical protein
MTFAVVKGSVSNPPYDWGKYSLNNPDSRKAFIAALDNLRFARSSTMCWLRIGAISRTTSNKPGRDTDSVAKNTLSVFISGNF